MGLRRIRRMYKIWREKVLWRTPSDKCQTANNVIASFICNINRRDRGPAKPSPTYSKLNSPQTRDVRKAWNVVFHRVIVIVIVDTARRMPFLMRYDRELAPSMFHGACQGTDASLHANK